MIAAVAKLLAILPLPWTHCLGAGIGQLFYWFDFKGKRTAWENLTQSNLFLDAKTRRDCLKQSYIEIGKGALESLALWAMPMAKIEPLIKQVSGWQLLDEAYARQQSVIFLTPHLGCFEITSLCIGRHYPVTVLYRPPKKANMEGMMISGRAKGKVNVAAANVQGVRLLMQALKRKEFIGILPDQIPAAGEGEWAPFFGKPAYTMTLASKLAEKTQSQVIMTYGERMPNGAGFHVHFTAVESIANVAQMNEAVAKQIAECPTQYLWRYPRFKVRHFAREAYKSNAEAKQ